MSFSIANSINFMMFSWLAPSEEISNLDFVRNLQNNPVQQKDADISNNDWKTRMYYAKVTNLFPMGRVVMISLIFQRAHS